MIKITLIAGRGAGKSFVATLIAQHLSNLGYEVSMDQSVHTQLLPLPVRGFGKIEINELEPY